MGKTVRIIKYWHNSYNNKILNLPYMSINYYGMALLQEMLYMHNLRQIQKLTQEISTLQSTIFSKQKKHRRCDRDLTKNFHCDLCDKVYASDVALKLHIKLKHRKTYDHQTPKETTSHQESEHATPQSI